MIDVAGIQRMLANLDPIGIANEAGRLRKAATGVRETGENINHAWTHSLNPNVYEAPEGELLRQAARPVQDNSAEFAWGVWQVAGALEAYAEEIRPIKTRLEALLVDAHAFVLNAGDDWQEDEDQVAENNRLVAAVRDQAIALANAEEACAAKIHAAYGGRAPGPMCVDAPSSPPPWGTAEEADLPWYDDALNAVQSFGGGLWEVTWGGFSTLAGFRGGDAAGEAWAGLGKWALSSAIVSIPGAQSLLVFDPVRDMVWNSNKEMVKGFAAWDEWSEDPARAAGMVFGNVLMLAGAKKVPTVARGAGKAARAANTGLRAVTAAGRALDPMTQLTYAGAKAINVGKAVQRIGAELKNPANYRVGPQLAMAGGPDSLPPSTSTGARVSAKAKEVTSAAIERAKSWLTLAEGPKEPDASSTGSSPSGRGPSTEGGEAANHGDSSLAMSTNNPSQPLPSKGETSAAWDVHQQYHADARNLLERLPHDQVSEVTDLLREHPRDVEELLRQFEYKDQKAARAGELPWTSGREVPAELRESLQNLHEVRQRGYPFGFESRVAFDTFKDRVVEGLEKYGVSENEILVHGSSVHRRNPGDVDVAILVNRATMERYANQFLAHTRMPKIAKRIRVELANGKIPYYRFMPREDGFEFGNFVRDSVDDRKVQVSMISEDGAFNVGPYLPF